MPLDPTPTPTPPPVAPAVVSDAPPAAPAVPPPPPVVQIPQDELTTLRNSHVRLQELEAEARKREELLQQEKIKALTDKGQVEEAFKSMKAESEGKLRAESDARQRSEERAKRYALDNELAKAMSMHPLLPGTNEQLTSILRNQLQVEAQGDSYVVRTPAFVSAIDHVSQTLAKPEFAHFLRPHGAGGAGAGGANAAPTPPANPAPAPQPKNFGEAIILQMQELARNRTAVDASKDMTQSFGLGASKASRAKQA